MSLEWRPIQYAPGYEVSNDGRVRSWRPVRNKAPIPNNPRLLTIGKDRDGYSKTTLYVNEKPVTCRVAVLVAESWHGSRPFGMVVRHLDGSKDNDAPMNLAWGTPLENSADSVIHGSWVHGEKVNTAKLTEDGVVEILQSDAGHSELARKYNVTPGAIWHIRAGRTWKHVTR